MMRKRVGDPEDRAIQLRSALYIQGYKEDWIRKSPQYGSDALILELEDSVPDREKLNARSLISKLVAELGDEGLIILVRVNGFDSGLTEGDVRAVVKRGLYGIILPMVRGSREVIAVDKMISEAECEGNISIGSILLDPGLETAAGIRSAYEIAISSDRIAHMGVSCGKDGDLARDVGYRWTPIGAETLYLRSRVLLDSRAASIPFPMTGLWQDLKDIAGLEKFALQSRNLGYTGMHIIHPSHVSVVNRAFSPTREEIMEWQGLLEAMETGRKAGNVAINYRGVMVDTAHETTAINMLSRAQAMGLVSE